MSYALLFVRDISGCPDSLVVDAGDADTFFVSGLSAGEWVASAGGKTQAVTVCDDELFAKFTLAKGTLTLTKK